MNTIKLFFEKDWTQEEKVLLSLTCILGGLVVGLAFSSSQKRTMKRRVSYSLPHKEEYWIDGED